MRRRTLAAAAGLSLVVVGVTIGFLVSGSPPSSGPTSGLSPAQTTRGDSDAEVRWTPSPAPTLQWQWELDHPLNLASAADMGTASRTVAGVPAGQPTVYDLDAFDTPARTVTALHRLGAHVICYVDVGTAEDFRPDNFRFPHADLGRSNGWPGERWLDVADPAIRPVIERRFAMCTKKGFDAVEPDNIDGASNDTGFAISSAQQAAYDEWVARAVHALGMSVAQKNDGTQTPTLLPFFDFAIVEQCFQYGGCADFAPYIEAHKAVLEVEYSDQGADPDRSCPSAIADGFSSVEFDTALDGRVRVPCA